MEKFVTGYKNGISKTFSSSYFRISLYQEIPLNYAPKL